MLFNVSIEFKVLNLVHFKYILSRDKFPFFIIKCFFINIQTEFMWNTEV